MKTNKIFKFVAILVVVTTIFCTAASVASAGWFDIFNKNDTDISFNSGEYSTDTDFYSTDTDFVTRTDFSTSTDCEESEKSLFRIIYERILSWFRKLFVWLQLS